jgi:acetoacetate decarboxylase
VHTDADFQISVISGFRRDVDDICVLPGYYAVSRGYPVPTFRDNLSVPSSRVKKSKKISGSLSMGPIRCPETTMKYYHSTLRNDPEERRYHFQIAPQAALCHV